tara:strand:+ start:418 stop:600 length:183 start_codon:yes stop_codon:yes gene_type:complete
MSTATEVKDLITTLTEALADVTKHEDGNNAAGARLRKSLQHVATTCKGLRKVVQEERTER